MKALREYGRDSPYFQGLLSSLLAGQVVVPHDLKQLFRCLSNKTEYKLWEATWRDLLGRTLSSLLKDPTTSTDNGGDPITLEHLVGEGEWKRASDQAEDIPEGVLDVIKEKAQKAFCEMKPEGPLTPYAEIFQGPTESFASFVERLTTAVEQQVPRVHAREEILEEMVSSHANERCTEAILQIPKQPREYPTLDEMLKANDDTFLPDLTEDPSRVSTPEKTLNPPPQDVPPTEATRLILPEPEGSLTTTSRYEPFQLMLAEPLHLQDHDWHTAVVSKERGTWELIEAKYVVVGDCKFTPYDIQIAPGTITSDPERFVLWLCTENPPTFLPRGQVIAQLIPNPLLDALDIGAVKVGGEGDAVGDDCAEEVPRLQMVKKVTRHKPQDTCKISVGGESKLVTGVWDTGVDVTVIPESVWPSHWELQNVAKHVSGVGGLQLAHQSKDAVQIEGPKGQLASLRPFVLDYDAPLWGRDLMAQWGVTIGFPDPPQIRAATIEERPTQKLNWLTDEPVWVEQWPLSKQKLKALNELVEEQFRKSNIVESTSPWNSPIFVIQKSDKTRWRLLHDLRKINEVIENMGPLQPGMPSLTMLPQNWNLAIIDLKDCFFQIPLHPDDAPHFAFSVPTINREAPRKRYHWQVLPQGMKNSPVICQWYVSSLLAPVRAAAHQAIIHHYMDDVLVCAPNDDLLAHALDLTVASLVAAGFELQDTKIQKMPPWKYLGLEIGRRTIVPQQLAIKTKIKTLADVHQLCGTLNWVRPWLGLSTEDLAPLFSLLKGGEEGLSSPRSLTPAAKEALEKVQNIMSTRQAHRCKPDLPFRFIIFGKLPHLQGLIFQWDDAISKTPRKDRGGDDPLSIIEWVFLSHQRSKRMTKPQELMADLIRKARLHLRELAGCDFTCIHIPIRLQSGQISKAMLEHLLQENESLQFALDNYSGQISIFRAAHKIFNSDSPFQLELISIQREKSADAIRHLVFAFSFLDIPKSLKTDNGPAYTSREFCSFLQQWRVEHKTGIPYSPTGQAIVERTHRNIKRVLNQQKPVLKNEPCSVRLARALFTLNFLNCSFETMNPPVTRHFRGNAQLAPHERPKVLIKDPETLRTQGPHDLITWGRGYACVSTDTSLRWIASRNVRPYVAKPSKEGQVSQVAVASWRRRKKKGPKSEWQKLTPPQRALCRATKTLPLWLFPKEEVGNDSSSPSSVLIPEWLYM
ncbi:hypothetical protein HGM15179_014027 [Zosterops borbonicus]|uniref:ribonuclease H n=1 Tax=Zosterops borbonicus TaxID=364589 RepID=A0A8K1G7P3_9PASS|nr:hypothetical protein HGM15179_014027 [Zosterops borbonicus]